MPMVSDQQIVSALINQVAKAAGGDSERNITTLISRPMWNAFLRGIGEPEDSAPTDWLGLEKTIRVYGSKTIVIDRDDFWSLSTKTPLIPLDAAP